MRKAAFHENFWGLLTFFHNSDHFFTLDWNGRKKEKNKTNLKTMTEKFKKEIDEIKVTEKQQGWTGLWSNQKILGYSRLMFNSEAVRGAGWLLQNLQNGFCNDACNPLAFLANKKLKKSKKKTTRTFITDAFVWILFCYICYTAWKYLNAFKWKWCLLIKQ